MSEIETLLSALVSIFICALAFGGGAYIWLACQRQDELDRRARREIERATRYAETNPQAGHVARRDAA